MTKRVVAPWLWCFFFLVLIWGGIIYWGDHVFTRHEIPVSCMTSQLNYHQENKTMVVLGNSLLEAAFPASIVTDSDIKDQVAVVSRLGMRIDDLDLLSIAFQERVADVIAIQDTIFRHTKRGVGEAKKNKTVLMAMASRFVRFQFRALMSISPICGGAIEQAQKKFELKGPKKKNKGKLSETKIKKLEQHYQSMTEKGVSEKAIEMVRKATESGASIIVFEIPRSVQVPEDRLKKGWRALLRETLEPYDVRFAQVGVPMEVRFYRDISHVNAAGNLQLKPHFEKFVREATN